ncbi:hypothetical protein HHK36_012449 [Tetracentron sinense]|uniref:SANT domain-containing protein n=1 Tax=Tetracentron sinense TaxID=13715 RepID=A0A835DIP3_TETSI|nr:hypothetical protein HHK36_012449 [Tetracentron sinense]
MDVLLPYDTDNRMGDWLINISDVLSSDVSFGFENGYGVDYPVPGSRPRNSVLCMSCLWSRNLVCGFYSVVSILMLVCDLWIDSGFMVELKNSFAPIEANMDSIQLDHDKECIGDTSVERLLSPGSPDINDIFGDPQALPRVGDQYQVEIPPLITEADRLQLLKNPIDTEVMVDVHSLLMGLPIPIMWFHDEVNNIRREEMEFLGDPNDAVNTNESVESENRKDRQINLKKKDLKLEAAPLDVVASDYGKVLGGSTSLEHTVVDDQIDMDFTLLQVKKMSLDQKYRRKRYCPVPGSLGSSWRYIEQDSFLLGLYIFGKNLVQVKRFIESKEMGDILSFYYGKFYRSDGHCRWLECRKIRSRKCIHGQRIFTGWRQQELLSRLLPCVSEECQNTLLEVSKTFGEGKISLEEYVSTLKAKVGMKILIEAVGIGKGKKDLTGIIMEPIKTNPVIPLRPEIPIGKACSSLTSGDIIKFLTGDFRLSKARSNDLFWEAVWPRLLARGWHSEQPKNHSYAGSKHSLMFLIPGVKKFSRRILEKGNHYFDSVSDVLNKVASNPQLLELEVESAKGSRGKEDYGWDTEAKLDQDGLSDHQRHCYLRPRISNCNPDLMKFTVVDTSLVHGEEPAKVRELRSLPVDTTNTHTPTCISRGNGGDTYEQPLVEPDSANILPKDKGDTNTSNPAKDIIDRGILSVSSDCVITALNQGMQINGQEPTNVPLDNHNYGNTNMSNGKEPRKNIKCQFRRRVKPGDSNNLAPVTKRRRLTACTLAETSCGTNNISLGPRLKEEELHFQSDSPDASENMVSQVGPSQEKVSSTSSSAKGSPDESSEGIFSNNCLEAEVPHEKPQPRTLFDLNLPHIPSDFEIVEPFIMEVADSQDDPSAEGSSSPFKIIQNPEDPEALGTSNGGASAEQQPVMNARRQSTRNRPLTMRALEALACGFLNTKRRRKGTNILSRENSMSKPSWQSHGRVGVTANFVSVGTGIMDSKAEERMNGVCSSNTNMANKSQVRSEKKGTHVSLGVPKTAYHPEVLIHKDN